jgi:hypothetical protein
VSFRGSFGIVSQLTTVSGTALAAGVREILDIIGDSRHSAHVNEVLELQTRFSRHYRFRFIRSGVFYVLEA